MIHTFPVCKLFAIDCSLSSAKASAHCSSEPLSLAYVSALHHRSTGTGLSKGYIADDVGVLNLGTAVGTSERALIGDLGICRFTFGAGIAGPRSLCWWWVGENGA